MGAGGLGLDINCGLAKMPGRTEYKVQFGVLGFRALGFRV